MILESRALWLAQTNTYVIAPERGGPAVVVDAPPAPSGVLDLLSRHDLTPVALLLTHGHVDHMGGSGELARNTKLATYVHPEDDFLTLDPASQLRALFGMMPPGEYGAPRKRHDLKHGDVLSLAGLELEVIHTPGHTPGHCCFRLATEEWLFSGDQLFAGSIGRTDLPGGSMPELMRSMRERVMTLPDDTRVLPGHGPETTMARERYTNPFRSEWT